MGIKFNIANNATRFNAAASAGASADHTRLSNRDAANQHPISAIAGLAQALENAGYDDTSIQQRISAIEEKESVWDAKYTKPVNGISRTDLSATVKTSLNKADSALQEVPEGYATESYVDNHHDLTKQDKISDLDTIRSGAAKGATSIQTESDPTVPPWAKAAQKPTYTASEVGAAEAVHRHTLADLDGALVKAVNGISPDSNGNVTLPIPSDAHINDLINAALSALDGNGVSY